MLHYPHLLQPERYYSAEPQSLLLATELDRTRIVQSAPVRRLQQKTQVFPLDVKASVRSRLTHSLEVQQAGRQIIFAIRQMQHSDWAEQVVMNLIEMSCLLHDVGNPPFGHFGEAVLREWLHEELDSLFAAAISAPASEQWQKVLAPDLCSFDGNAQSLRLVHSLQKLNLTLSQLACIIKYPRVIDEFVVATEGKIGVFISERHLIERIRDVLQLPAGVRHPLVFIMEAADDISYSIADVDDAVDRKLLSLDDVINSLIQQVDDETRAYLKPMLDDARQDDQGFFPRFRYLLTNDWVQLAAESYLNHKTDILAGHFVGHLLECEHPAIHVLNALKRLARQSIFGRPEVESLELSGYAAMRGVLLSYSELLTLPAHIFQQLLSGEGHHRYQHTLRLCHRLSRRHVVAYQQAVDVDDPFFQRPTEQEWYYRVRLLLDFISGMTDTYVLEEYRLLNGLV
jgi:dGTPase